MNRRLFLQSCTGAAATAPAFRAAPDRPRAGLKLGFDAYTIRGMQWKAIRLLDYAAEQKLDVVHIDLNDFESEDPAYCARVKDHAARLGIQMDGSIGSVCPTSSSWQKKNGDPITYLSRGLNAFQRSGAKCMRVFLGGGAERTGPVPLAKHMEAMAVVLKQVRSQAMDLDMKIAIENHGDLQAWELLQLIESAGKDWVGVCLDSGNAVAAIEDPLLTLESLAPYVLTTHIRDSVIFEDPTGAAMQWVALGDGAIDFRTFFARFRELCPSVPVHLEILTGSPVRVHSYLNPDFWKAYPQARASEFARFVALAKKGRPFTGTMMIAGRGQRSSAYEEAMREQQRLDLERSLTYAKDVLGLGIRGRA